MVYHKYTKQILQEAVLHSSSVAGVLRYLGLKQAGGTQAHIATRIRQEEIDTAHFTGQGHNKNKVSHNRKTAEAILVLLPEGSSKQKAHRLKRTLLELGVPYKCALCPMTDTWQGLPLVLEIDHIDGNWLNNLFSNLRFLCPNCHSQQKNTNLPHKYRT